MTAVELEDLTFRYDRRPVVDDVSLEVEEGGFLGLVGPNGSGKTTLVELTIGLRRPDSGSVKLFGDEPDVARKQGRVGYVPQDTVDAGGRTPVTVEEVVRMGRYPGRLRRRFGDTDHNAVADALERAGVDDLSDERLGELSGGQRQRVFIARALAADADLLVLDEPAVGVDSRSRERFYDLLERLNSDGMTVVLVEHDVGVVTAHATEVACMNGELYFHGEPESFLETDALDEAYGGDGRLLHHDH